MIKIYVKSNCRFSAHALAVLDAYELKYEERNVADPGVTEQLIKLGGKKQEPFLVDGDTMLYESDAIAEYIERTYAKEGETKPKIHLVKRGETCAI